MHRSDFAAYLRLSGLDEAQAVAASEKLGSWDELCDWLDRNGGDAVQPPARRTSMVSPGVNTSWKHAIREKLIGRRDPNARRRAAGDWRQVVAYRQRVALALTLVLTACIVVLSDYTLRAQAMSDTVRDVYLVVYTLMSFFLVSNFCKLMLGWWHNLRGPARNPWHPSHTACDPRPDVRVAVLFPVYHEGVARVAAGVAATWQSIRDKHPELADRFDIYLISDSRRASYAIAEEAAVYRLRHEFPEGRFYYRRRTVNLNAKMGNVADFCRRWGRDYEYMLVMDADSVMDGDAIIPLLRMMEGNERIGILQTNPTPILRSSLFGRMQQFAGRLYGSVFSYSLQAMLMGNASYIGHNAMIRLKPFMEHCILPELPGRAPWGGKPLSHDIIESALMARAGYEVWFLPEIEGSYEEIPANILAFLIRERRWMQGNLQHMRFVLVDGLQSIHRETFINGSMGYVSAPLWAIFLVVSAYGMVSFLQRGVLAFLNYQVLEMPMIMLFVSSMVFLFMPRMLALAVHLERGRARLFGGKDKLLWSMAIETVFSFFFSPIIMIFITGFMWLWLRRKSISWKTQQRDDEPLPWDTCFRYFGLVSVVGVLCWSAMVYKLHGISGQSAQLLYMFSDGWVRPSDILLWFFPILGGFAGSVWIARVTSISFPWMRGRQLFCIPEEIDTPVVIRDVVAWEKRFQQVLPDEEKAEAAWRHALGDVGFFVRHLPMTRRRAHVAKTLLPKIRAGERLTEKEMLVALQERECFGALHGVHGGWARGEA
ncbi:MAG TPA: glucans biosynthesis glucosyltransferase MdoH, partial [Rhodopila sp.]|nr:glucans biosynthesis glucosyltransferase MdoH [Rhodopila sp.]